MRVTRDLGALSKSPEPADKHNDDARPYWGGYVQLRSAVGALDEPTAVEARNS